MDAVLFAISLAFIFAGSSLFTNCVEWLGRHFNLSEGAVGSVLAAVGTALPETLIPLIAIFFVGGTSGDEVGIGAILGAPFMLGTLALFITGLSVLAFKRRRHGGTHLRVAFHTQQRDLSFFLPIYLAAVGASLLPNVQIKLIAAPLFVIAYIVYVGRVFSENQGSSDANLAPLRFDAWLARARKRSPNEVPPLWLVIVQTLISLELLILGAQLFVEQIVSLAELLSINATVLTLIVAPIATELPEKLNSVLWVRQGKDTLALGNITGAMVFQSCIPVALGIAFTTWTLELVPLISALLAIAAGVWTLILVLRRRLTALSFFFNGILYFLFLAIVLLHI